MYVHVGLVCEWKTAIMKVMYSLVYVHVGVSSGNGVSGADDADLTSSESAGDDAASALAAGALLEQHRFPSSLPLSDQWLSWWNCVVLLCGKCVRCVRRKPLFILWTSLHGPRKCVLIREVSLFQRLICTLLGP